MAQKMREVGGCLIITIPKQIAKMYKFKVGDFFDWEFIGVNELKLKKVKEAEK